MKKVTLLLLLCLTTLSGFATGYFPLSVDNPDDGSGTSPTVCSGDPNGSYSVNVTMCSVTSPLPAGGVPVTVKWFFNDPAGTTPVYTEVVTFTSTATTVLALPAGTFNWPAPFIYSGTSGLRVELSWGPPPAAPPGCTSAPVLGASTTIAVSSASPPILGSTYICVGATHTLTSTAGGGVWLPVSASNATAATGSPATIGLITGVSVGTALISYTGGSCMTPATIVVTVSTTPPPINPAAPTVCTGETILLTDTMTGGTWMSTGSAVVDPLSGAVTGSPVPGTAIITYTAGTLAACRTTRIVTVYPMPTPIGSTAPMFCSGVASTFTSTPTGGTWSSSHIDTATINPTTGVAFGIGGGTTTITYSRLGCSVTLVATVIQSPSIITGPSYVCTGGTITLSDSVSGGTWASSNLPVGTVDVTSGVVDGLTIGTTIISYKISICAPALKTVNVTAPPGPIGGNVPVCKNNTITLTNGVFGGVWKESSPLISIDSVTGQVTALNAGTAVVTYTIGTNCNRTTIVTVNPLPQPITGPSTVCLTYTETLSDADPGGTWTSGTPSTISITPATGYATGNNIGITNITYTLPTGCRTTRSMSVSPLPSAISGPTSVCEGAIITLSNPTLGGGTWSSSNTTNAAVGVTTGYVTGAFGGVSGTTATITFTATNTGCFISRPVSVNPLPTQFNVTGGGSYCAGSPVAQAIGLSGSSSTLPSTTYRLFLGATLMAGPIPGSGSAIPFGSFATVGTYTVQASIAGTGCTAPMLGSAVITANPIVTPAVTLTTPSGTSTVCGGLSLTFTATPSNGGPSPTYQWRVNGSPVGTSSPTHTYMPTNGDVLSVTMTTSAPCPTVASAVATYTLTVLPSGMPSVTTSVAPSNTVCAGTSVVFSATGVNGGATPSFRWTKNGTNVATGPTYTFMPANGDVIYCMMLSSATCNLIDSVFSPLTTMTVTVPGAPPSVFISATPGTTITPGTSDTLIATALGAGATPTFQWYINGVAIAGATGAMFVSNTFSNHDSVTCKVTSSNVCKEVGAKSLIITVKNGNSGGVGVNNLEVGEGVYVTPNPNNGVFTIKGQWSNENNEKVSLEVTDMVGKVIYTGKTTTTAGNVNAQIVLPSVPAGMYMINMRSDSGSKVFRVVKE